MVPNFSLRQLSYLVAVAETGSMTAAAETEHVSQAAISAGIHDLERGLGAQLLARRPGHGVTLTEAGLEVVADARRVLAAAADVQSSARTPDADLRGVLRLGCYSTLAPLYLPPLHGTFAVQHPAVELSVIEESQEELRRALTSGACELAVTYDTGLGPGLATETIRSLRPYALLPADHRLAAETTVTVEDLADEPLVVYAQGPSPGNTEQLFRDVGAVPRIVHTSANIEVVRCLVARGLGWTHLVQRWPLDVSLEGEPLVCIPLSGNVPVHRVVAAWPEQDRLSRRAAAVVSFLHDAAQRIGGFSDCDPAPGAALASSAAPPAR
ncbi:LysR family transcriptional regulator [Modestobacter roseus]|uniref:DNA-binding transcriptional LysR family regulator n=1 Tax=Modestobacter roseus TaxID=1181884 RepID=A0A562IPP6_9ACTN|nr:LysR family transcriptional regulator [Modestobacter roseus]MQA34378.1 LysR family transcriptional regulator [Modestobacter roseus]TWH72705.1 DNA-binding transcriptional LysR family regulator [Modestobacter roseus]